METPYLKEENIIKNVINLFSLDKTKKRSA